MASLTMAILIMFVRPPGMVVLRPEQYFRKAVMYYYRCCLFFHYRISEHRRPIAVKLCHVISIWLNFVMQVKKFYPR